MLTRQNMCIQPSMTFKIGLRFRGFIEIAWFPYGWLPSVDVDKHYDGSPSKVRQYTWRTNLDLTRRKQLNNTNNLLHHLFCKPFLLAIVCNEMGDNKIYYVNCHENLHFLYEVLKSLINFLVDTLADWIKFIIDLGLFLFRNSKIIACLDVSPYMRRTR